MMHKLVLLFCILTSSSVWAQNESIGGTVNYSKRDLQKTNKGKVFVIFGWNWSRYTNSDIHFKGENHNFILENVVAHDRPPRFSAELYFRPQNLSIPQTNLKVGYFFHNNWNLAFGLDHMKYVVEQFQEVKINGSISEGSIYDNTYNDQTIVLNQNFLEYEHTDGLNFIHFEFNRFDRVLKTRWFDIAFTEGFSLGAVVPRSDVVLLENGEWDKYNLSGYGFGLKAAINITFFNYFYIQSEAKGGFIHLPDVQTSPSKNDKANQHFFWFQHNLLFGAVFPILKKEKRSKYISE